MILDDRGALFWLRCLRDWLSWLAGWLAGWLGGWLAWWLAGWLAGWLTPLSAWRRRSHWECFVCFLQVFRHGFLFAELAQALLT